MLHVFIFEKIQCFHYVLFENEQKCIIFNIFAIFDNYYDRYGIFGELQLELLKIQNTLNFL